MEDRKNNYNLRKRYERLRLQANDCLNNFNIDRAYCLKYRATTLIQELLNLKLRKGNDQLLTKLLKTEADLTISVFWNTNNMIPKENIHKSELESFIWHYIHNVPAASSSATIESIL